MIHLDLPGADILEAGLADLRANRCSPQALAICAMKSRLRNCGVDVPESNSVGDAEVLMYRELRRIGERNPHAAMNGILRRLDAYASNAEARRHRRERQRFLNR